MNAGVSEILLLTCVTVFGAFYGLVTGKKQDSSNLAPGVLVDAYVGASMGRWASGFFLFFFIVFWLSNVFLIAGCATLSGEGELKFADCDDYLAVRYVAFNNFQTGIGGLIGLLGLAWAAAYGLQRGK